MHAQDAGVQSSRGSCVVKGELYRAEVLDAAVEHRADGGEIATDRIRRNPFQLPHTAVWQHHSEERQLPAECPPSFGNRRPKIAPCRQRTRLGPSATGACQNARCASSRTRASSSVSSASRSRRRRRSRGPDHARRPSQPAVRRQLRSRGSRSWNRLSKCHRTANVRTVWEFADANAAPRLVPACIKV
jgi:hypothetical protein